MIGRLIGQLFASFLQSSLARLPGSRAEEDAELSGARSLTEERYPTSALFSNAGGASTSNNAKKGGGVASCIGDTRVIDDDHINSGGGSASSAVDLLTTSSAQGGTDALTPTATTATLAVLTSLTTTTATATTTATTATTTTTTLPESGPAAQNTIIQFENDAMIDILASSMQYAEVNENHQLFLDLPSIAEFDLSLLGPSDADPKSSEEVDAASVLQPLANSASVPIQLPPTESATEGSTLPPTTVMMDIIDQQFVDAEQLVAEASASTSMTAQCPEFVAEASTSPSMPASGPETVLTTAVIPPTPTPNSTNPRPSKTPFPPIAFSPISDQEMDIDSEEIAQRSRDPYFGTGLESDDDDDNNDDNDDNERIPETPGVSSAPDSLLHTPRVTHVGNDRPSNISTFGVCFPDSIPPPSVDIPLMAQLAPPTSNNVNSVASRLDPTAQASTSSASIQPLLPEDARVSAGGAPAFDITQPGGLILKLGGARINSSGDNYNVGRNVRRNAGRGGVKKTGGKKGDIKKQQKDKKRRVNSNRSRGRWGYTEQRYERINSRFTDLSTLIKNKDAPWSNPEMLSPEQAFLFADFINHYELHHIKSRRNNYKSGGNVATFLPPFDGDWAKYNFFCPQVVNGVVGIIATGPFRGKRLKIVGEEVVPSYGTVNGFKPDTPERYLYIFTFVYDKAVNLELTRRVRKFANDHNLSVKYECYRKDDDTLFPKRGVGSLAFTLAMLLWFYDGCACIDNLQEKMQQTEYDEIKYEVTRKLDSLALIPFSKEPRL